MAEPIIDDPDLTRPDLADVRLPVVLVPTRAELVAQVRALPVVTKMVTFARWIEDCQELNDDGWLYPDQARAAAAALDLPLEASQGASKPELILPDVWAFAGMAGFLDRDYEYACDDEGEETDEIEVEYVLTTDLADSWPDVPDDDVLSAWERMLATALLPPDSSDLAEAEAGLASAQQLAQLGPMSALTVLLDIYNGGSVDLGPFAEALGDRVSGELLGGRGKRECRELAGEAIDVPFRLLAHVGAVQRDGDTVTLTPLGRWGLAQHLRSLGCDAPTVESVLEATAAELLELVAGAESEQANGWLAEWIGARSNETATSELITVAGSEERRLRAAAFEALAVMGAPASPAVRKLLDEPGLRPYAIDWLRRFGDDNDRQLVPTPDDERLRFVDAVGAALESDDPHELSMLAAVDVPLVEQLWRCDHPDTRTVLEFMGVAHPVKQVAKAARKAAFKLRSRPAA